MSMLSSQSMRELGESECVKASQSMRELQNLTARFSHFW